jgi:hypothetical protein
MAEMLPIFAADQKAKRSTYLQLISIVLSLSTRQLNLSRLSEIAKEAKRIL